MKTLIIQLMPFTYVFSLFLYYWLIMYSCSIRDQQLHKQKCVPLEDLAAEFNLRTQECINRIASLESIGRLSGVMDDRGKYIYISMEEMNAVADYIKRQGRKQKCVPLEDLAAEFNLRTQECINRIASLESIGRLSGVMDDREKYIYISMEEMNAVADYIKRQGRVSISHLASKSNQFIDLEPKVQDQLTGEISGMEEISVS
ncbi:hypothetical protein DY000_02038529 [Brassica cretica]|uniref:DDRGK domain-containing protein 1 n=1 Tax=Brassica cretica TaxID=69181 RepID=A0ABQ7BDR0_BRACR|nr:hypothetical protein DY000_02038529 [Brassica cretica]